MIRNSGNNSYHRANSVANVNKGQVNQFVEHVAMMLLNFALDVAVNVKIVQFSRGQMMYC